MIECPHSVEPSLKGKLIIFFYIFLYSYLYYLLELIEIEKINSINCYYYIILEKEERFLLIVYIQNIYYYL